MDRPNRIERLRTRQKLTQTALADELNRRLGAEYVQATVSRWESGKLPVPDDVKLALAEIFRVSVVYVMGWRENSQNGENGSDLEEAV